MADAAANAVVEGLSKYDPKTGRFLVKWAGKTGAKSTWEAEENLPQELILAWDANGGYPATAAREISFGFPLKRQSLLARAIDATALAAAASNEQEQMQELKIQRLSGADIVVAAVSTIATSTMIVAATTSANISPLALNAATKPTGTASGADGTEMAKLVCGWKGCRKTFASAGSRRRHTLSHTGTKPFACTWKNCAYRSTQSGNLKVHVRIHTKEKPFNCKWAGCQFRCGDSSNMKTHTQIHIGDTAFDCLEAGCGFSAAKYTTFKRHTRTHTGESLLNHKPQPSGPVKPAISTCTSDTPFQCNWTGCLFKGTEASDLTSHTRRHTGLQLARMALFGCSKAGCTFLGVDGKSLSQHLELHAVESTPFITPTHGHAKVTAVDRRAVRA
jgi:uncharacterized Zn-finger protein